MVIKDDDELRETYYAFGGSDGEMKMSNSGLIVRRSVRFEISLPARVRVAPHHAEALNFSKGVTDENRWINVDVIDFASGGMGFVLNVYLPRNVDVEIEIPDFHDQNAEPMLQCMLKVKRIQMTDRRPAYQVGCSFTEVDEESRKSIEQMIDRLRGMSGEDQEGEDVGYL